MNVELVDAVRLLVKDVMDEHGVEPTPVATSRISAFMVASSGRLAAKTAVTPEFTHPSKTDSSTRNHAPTPKPANPTTESCVCTLRAGDVAEPGGQVCAAGLHRHPQEEDQDETQRHRHHPAQRISHVTQRARDPRCGRAPSGSGSDAK
jgi:hypothetical protein